MGYAGKMELFRERKMMNYKNRAKMNHFGVVFFSVIAALALLFPGNEARAQVSCTGDACAALPIFDDLNRIYAEFEQQYTNKLFDDMAEAAAAANLFGIPGSTVNLTGFTMGLMGSAGYLPAHDVQVNITGVGSFDSIPSAGGSVLPGAFIGINLGRILNKEGKYKKKPGYFSPQRFDIYLSGLDIGNDYDSDKVKGELKVESSYRGAEVRYHVMEGRSLIAGPMLYFKGISFGAGVYKSKQKVDYLQESSNFDLTTVQTTRFIWSGSNVIHYNSNIDSYIFQLKTGIQLYYVLNISLGGGVALNKGATEFELQRYGPIVAEGNPLAGVDFNIPPELMVPGLTSDQLAAQLDSATSDLSADAVLTMTIKGKGRVPARMPFARAGIELNLWTVKLSMDALMTKRTYAANVAFRFEI